MGVRRRVRSAAKRALHQLGLEYVQPTGFNRLLRAEHARASDYVVVQVGANDGIAWDDLYDFVSTHACRGLFLEPVPYYFEMLQKTYAAYPALVPVQLAVHKTQTEATLYRVNPDAPGSVPAWAHGIGSLDPERHKKVGIASEHMLEESVRCAPLMQVLDAHDLDHVDLLQIDVEGYDAEVVRMIDFDRMVPRVIKYEHDSLDAADRRSVRDLLRGRGYRVFDMDTDTVAVQPDVEVPDLSPPRPRIRRRRSSLTVR